MCSTTGATIPRIQLCFRVDREALVDVTRMLVYGWEATTTPKNVDWLAVGIGLILGIL